ncbi:uncharacterized protein [Malus domestica]|uniref:uncharacterized protein isoform X3 n=1 Tax=Malus domestica TaxID=3750 RepID=UPI003974CAD0
MLRSTQRYSRCLFGICCAVYCLCQDLYGHFGSGKGDESTSFGFYLDIQEPPNCIMFSSPNSGQESCTCLMYYAKLVPVCSIIGNYFFGSGNKFSASSIQRSLYWEMEKGEHASFG